eukprot:m.248490 g.248490  ORF g.248490 m.248490 type:complete len:111 (+) comp40290_c0_seq17:2872-3204(+)
MVGVLLPILGYGSELWMIDKPKVSALLHRTWRRGFRRGLRVANRCSLREMYNGQFAEAEDLLRVSQMLFTWRICHSRSPVVRSFVVEVVEMSLAWLAVSVQRPSDGAAVQ